MKHCPACKNKGKRIDTATVKALLLSSLRHVSEKPYYFCSVADCDVVYFDEDGTETFIRKQIRERVYQKEPNSEDVLICYCFQHRVVDVHTDGEAIRDRMESHFDKSII
jgi:hypothetical protein